MTSLKNMTISVAGIEVTIHTDEDREYVLRLASQVDEKVTGYLKKGARVTVSMAAILAAMEFCDEFEKNRIAVENMRSQVRSYIDDAMRATNERDRLKAELDRVRQELDELQKEFLG